MELSVVKIIGASDEDEWRLQQYPVPDGYG